MYKKTVLPSIIAVMSAAVIICTFSACSDSETGEKTNSYGISEIRSELNDIKKKTYKNLDFNRAEVVNHSDIRCFKLSIEDTDEGNYGIPSPKMGEVLEKFEAYCVKYFGTYDERYAVFEPPYDSSYYNEICGDTDNAKSVADCLPNVNKYKEELISGTYKATSLYYYDNDHSRYMLWSDSCSEPNWINTGRLYSLYSDAKIGSWYPRDIDEANAVKKVYTGDFEKIYDQKYVVGADSMSLREAVSYIENSNPQGDMTPYVYKLRIYDMKNGSESIDAEYTYSYDGIPIDSFQEMRSSIDLSDVVQESRELVIDGRNHMDVKIDAGSPHVISKAETVPSISLAKAVSILSSKVTQSVKFSINSVEMVYTGKYTDSEHEKADIRPAWKFTADNQNDGLHYAFYIDITSGELNYYSYSDK